MRELDPADRIFIAGHRGLVGGALWRRLESDGFTNLTGRSHSDLDLRDADATEAFFAEERPDVVIMAAAVVGGIRANAAEPVPFLADNLLMEVNVLGAAHRFDVDRLLFLGSSCIYPRGASQPMKEEELLSGPLEPTNEPYALAKIAGVKLVEGYRRQFGRRWISIMPTNLYGPGDTFDLDRAHVLPALVRRFVEAVDTSRGSVTLWGTGTPRREFMHVDDLADACLLLLDRYDDDRPINVGVGEDVTIRELADLVATLTGYRGQVLWDASMPDGAPRKLLDTTRLADLGWRPRIPLHQGVAETIEWFRRQGSSVRTG